MSHHPHTHPDQSLGLRKARVRDLPEIFKLINAGTGRGKVLKRTMRDLRNTVRHFWVVERQGAIIGCCALEVYNKKLAEVRSLVVHHGEVGKGIATLLIGHCLREARKKKIYEVLAITDRENLFRRQGFSEQLHGQKAMFLRP
jgi:amino-acid N-acetyltransferase